MYICITYTYTCMFSIATIDIDMQDLSSRVQTKLLLPQKNHPLGWSHRKTMRFIYKGIVIMGVAKRQLSSNIALDYLVFTSFCSVKRESVVTWLIGTSVHAPGPNGTPAKKCTQQRNEWLNFMSGGGGGSW